MPGGFDLGSMPGDPLLPLANALLPFFFRKPLLPQGPSASMVLVIKRDIRPTFPLIARALRLGTRRQHARWVVWIVDRCRVPGVAHFDQGHAVEGVEKVYPNRV